MKVRIRNGSLVYTPLNRLARVMGPTTDNRLELEYLDDEGGRVVLQTKLLRHKSEVDGQAA